MRGPDHVRFHEYYIPEPMSGCFLWIGGEDRHGYGKFERMAPIKRTVQAHRYAWELDRGGIPAELVIDHLCRVRSCVNPRHMRVVTRRENTLCGVGPAAVNAKATHCPRGHAYDVENTYYGRLGRNCRACNREAQRRRSMRGTSS